MGGHGLALEVDHVLHVHEGGDGRLGHAESGVGRVDVTLAVLDVLGAGRVLGQLARLPRLFHQPEDVVAVEGRLEDVLGAGHLGGPDADPVDLDVVGMAVSTVVVVDGQDVGLLLGEDGGQSLGG